MRLTRLEIKGFKSFGDRVVIQFNEGITGIVGPNGCGKSNVVDAIRWVLGEQKTRALRSDKMENIIFNGTKSRKASQLAEVSLTFENNKNLLPIEYAQVTITRRYYRSGDSEYELNGVPCRLKDITGLFMDTGIASNSYAIIELKMIDELLNDKDNSRRGLFEEAAGISKFKSHKKQTLKKLEDTAADLDRVEDLLYEIEKNLKSLEKQAKQAERYYTLKNSYKAVSLQLAKVKLSDQQAILGRINSQLLDVDQRKNAAAALRTTTETSLEKVKADIASDEKLLASRQKTLNQHSATIRQLESDKKLKNERLRFLYDRRDALHGQANEDAQSLERIAFSIEKLEGEASALTQRVHEAEAILLQKEQAKAEAQQIAQRSQQVVTELTTRHKSLQEEVYGLQKDLELKQLQASTLRQELEKASVDAANQNNSLSNYLARLTQINQQVEGARQLVNDTRKQVIHHNKRIEEAEKSLEASQLEKQNTRRKLDARQNEYALTKSLVDSLEGFPEAIKFLKKNTNWGKQAPLLSDVFSSAENYRIALETFLEPYLNYYVVETLEQAREAIKLLDNASRGRANFFVLEMLKDLAKPADSLTTATSGIPALTLVEFDSKYDKLAIYLFGGVYFSDTEHLYSKNNQETVVHISGKVLQRKYSLAGGSVGLFDGKRIGRAKNLEKLKAEIQQLTKLAATQDEQTTTLTSDLKELKGKAIQAKLDDQVLQLNKIEQEQIQVQTQHEQITEILNSQVNKQGDLQDRLAEIEDRVRDIEPALEDKKEVFSNLLYELEEKASDSQLAADAYTKASETYNQYNIKYYQVANQAERITQEQEFKRSTSIATTEQLARKQAELSNIGQEITALLERNEVGDDELQALYSERDAIEQAVQEAERVYYASRAKADKLEKDLRELQHQRENSQAISTELKNKLHEISLQVNAIEERLAVEFGEDARQILEELPAVEELPPLTELQSQASTQKVQLEKLGPINPMAMEAYDEINERHTFITNQRNDLFAARQSLTETINQLDSAAREAFLDAFDKIKLNFIRVFRSLFTEEDDCDLKLVDPANPLESAIDIVAKPKGKKPLTINQLSGGEKTLTATSLLFSIYLLKPAPFCIFDEVDAPLDDANIDKFNTIIRKFSTESQFIIVTHNKRTMASTDIMYGVTMLEQGVSRVVPVDLRELDIL